MSLKAQDPADLGKFLFRSCLTVRSKAKVQSSIWGCEVHIANNVQILQEQQARQPSSATGVEPMPVSGWKPVRWHREA